MAKPTKRMKQYAGERVAAVKRRMDKQEITSMAATAGSAYLGGMARKKEWIGHKPIMGQDPDLIIGAIGVGYALFSKGGMSDIAGGIGMGRLACYLDRTAYANTDKG